jgi:hypothetical protein
MAENADVKRLELRIQELENQLKQFQSAAAPAPQEFTREEMAAFQKVSAALAPCDVGGAPTFAAGRRPTACISACTVCLVCRICYPCINECICGPCSICAIGGAGGGFSGFGG